jgi:hypothetical protein
VCRTAVPTGGVPPGHPLWLQPILEAQQVECYEHSTSKIPVPRRTRCLMSTVSQTILTPHAPVNHPAPGQDVQPGQDMQPGQDVQPRQKGEAITGAAQVSAP